MTQTELCFERARPTRFRDGLPGLIRSEIFRHRRAGQKVYEPRKTRADVLAILADGEWHTFLDLCATLGVGAYGAGKCIDLLERSGRLEKRENYFGADPLAPRVPPNPYRGFTWEYRLKPSTPLAPAS